MQIPFYYDPMIAKLICHAETRELAMDKMIRAIEEYEITGLATTLGFCDFVMKHPAFRSGDFDTNFVNTHFEPSLLNRPSDTDEALVAALLSATTKEDRTASLSSPAEGNTSLWKKNRLK